MLMLPRITLFAYFILGIFFTEIFLVSHLPGGVNFFFVPSKNNNIERRIPVADRFPSGRRKTAPEIRKNIQSLHKTTMVILKLYFIVFTGDYFLGNIENFYILFLGFLGFILIFDSRERIRIHSMRLYSDPER